MSSARKSQSQSVQSQSQNRPLGFGRRQSVQVKSKSRSSREDTQASPPERIAEETEEQVQAAKKLQSKWRAVRTERHVGLIRLIYKEARQKKDRRLSSTSDAQEQSGEELAPKSIQQVRAEVCKDLLGAVRKCTRMYKTMVFMKKEAEQMAHIRYLRKKLKTFGRLTGHVQDSAKKSRASDAQWSALASLVAHFDEMDDDKLYRCDRACRRVQKMWCNKRIAAIRLKLKILKALSSPTEEQQCEKTQLEEQLDYQLDIQKRLRIFEEWAMSFEHLANVASAKAAASAISMMSGEQIDVDRNGQARITAEQQLLPFEEEETRIEPIVEEAVDETADDSAEAVAETTDEVGDALWPEDTEGGGSTEKDSEDSVMCKLPTDIFEQQKVDSGRSCRDLIEEVTSDDEHGLSPSGKSTSLISPTSVKSHHSEAAQLHACNISFDQSLSHDSPRSSIIHRGSEKSMSFSRSLSMGGSSPRSRLPPTQVGDLPQIGDLDRSLELRKAGTKSRPAPLTGFLCHESSTSISDVNPVETVLVVGSRQTSASHAQRKITRKGSQIHPPMSIHHSNTTGSFSGQKHSSTDCADFKVSVAGHAALAHPRRVLHEAPPAPQSARVPRLEKIEHPSAPSADQMDRGVLSARAPSSHGQLRRRNAPHGSISQQPPGKLPSLPSAISLAPAMEVDHRSLPLANEPGHGFSIEGSAAARQGVQRQPVQPDMPDKRDRGSLPGALPNRPRFNPCAITANNRHSVTAPVACPRLGARGIGAAAGCDEDFGPLRSPYQAVPEHHDHHPGSTGVVPPKRELRELPRRSTCTRTSRIVLDDRNGALPPLESRGGIGGSPPGAISGTAAAHTSKSQPLGTSGKTVTRSDTLK